MFGKLLTWLGVAVAFMSQSVWIPGEQNLAERQQPQPPSPLDLRIVLGPDRQPVDLSNFPMSIGIAFDIIDQRHPYRDPLQHGQLTLFEDGVERNFVDPSYLLQRYPLDATIIINRDVTDTIPLELNQLFPAVGIISTSEGAMYDRWLICVTHLRQPCWSNQQLSGVKMAPSPAEAFAEIGELNRSNLDLLKSSLPVEEALTRYVFSRKPTEISNRIVIIVSREPLVGLDEATIQRAQAANVRLYMIQLSGVRALNDPNREHLESQLRLTGGEYYCMDGTCAYNRSSTEESPNLQDALVNARSGRYRIQYVPRTARDGQSHEIAVRYQPDDERPAVSDRAQFYVLDDVVSSSQLTTSARSWYPVLGLLLPVALILLSALISYGKETLT